MRASIVVGAWVLVGAVLTTVFLASRSDFDKTGGHLGTGTVEPAAGSGSPAARSSAPAVGSSRRVAVRARPPAPVADDTRPAGPDAVDPSALRDAAAGDPTKAPPGLAPGGGASSVRRASMPPRESVPEHAVLVDAASDVRAWLEVDRAPRGLESEPGSSPGRLKLCLSKSASTALRFRVESDPPGALRVVVRGDPVLKVAAGRDVASLAVAGVVRGTARVVVRLEEGGDAAKAPTFGVPISVSSQDDFASPTIEVRAESPPEGEASAALVGGGRELLGLRGGVAGRIVLRRSGFRGFATEATNVQIVADDPAGILEPIPWSVTILAGQRDAPAPVVIRLRDVEGEATLRFRAGEDDAAVVVRSTSARWTGPARIVLPVGAHAVVPLSLVPGAREMPRLQVAASDTGLAGVSVLAPSNAPGAERVELTLDARAVGETPVRLTAPSRPDFTATLAVVPREVEIRDGHVVLTGLVGGARGDLRLTVVTSRRERAATGAAEPAKAGRLVLDDGVGVPAGVAVERGGPSAIVLHLAIGAGGPGELMVPVRIEGSVEALRVSDTSRGEPRTEYTIDARP